MPLLILDPTRTFAVRRVAAQVRLLDVVPTIQELLGLPVPSGLDGRSLVPLMEGRERGDRIAVAGITAAGPERLAVSDGAAKLIANLSPDRSDPPIHPDAPPLELYDLLADPGETRNLAESRPGLRERLLSKLTRWKRDLARRGSGDLEVPPDLSRESRRRLEAMGYLDPGGRESPGR